MELQFPIARFGSKLYVLVLEGDIGKNITRKMKEELRKTHKSIDLSM